MASEAERKAMAMHDLLESEGWALLSEQFDKQIAQALAGMRNSKTPDEIARSGMVYVALLDIKAAPTMLYSFYKKSVDRTPQSV